jgi:WhiB family redox-sensing transcriptional regulator
MSRPAAWRTKDLADVAWQSEAACAKAPDPEIFFPLSEDGGESGRATIAKYCAGCPVKDACLDDALSDGWNQYGIRGGLTVKRRREILRQRSWRTV